MMWNDYRGLKANRRSKVIKWLCCVSALFWVAASVSADPIWIRQAGGTNYDQFRAVATDNLGNIVVAGQVTLLDPWVAKYNSAGTLLWQRRLSAFNDSAYHGVAIDGSGNIIVSMETDSTDAQVTKFNANGQQIWTRRFDSGTNDLEYRVAVDSLGDIYIAGSSGGLGSSERDVKLVKYGANGQRRWIKTIGSSDQDNCNGITVDDDDNVILAGTTYGPLFGPDPANTNRDAWVAKYDSNGLQLWGRQLDATPSTRQAYGNAVTTDADGNVLVVGETTGRIPGSTQDGRLWIASLRGANGNTRWVRQFTLAANSEYANAVAVDSTGSVYVAGQLNIASGANAFLRKYSSMGVFRWDSVIDSGDGDVGFGVAVGLDDYVYVAGQTSGALNGPNRGSTDGFLAKFAPD